MRLCFSIWIAIPASLLLFPSATYAHEVRPGYLDILETEQGLYRIMWKAPSRGGLVLKIRPRFPDDCRDTSMPSRRRLPGSFRERRIVTCGEAGLAGKTISIDGLSATITDVLVRVTHANGQSQTVLLKPHSPSFKVMGAQSWTQQARSYINLGIEHILFGVDHLLFVFGLLLLSRGWMPLLKTITAFTVGHSISLALAVLGFVNVPGKPLSAAIALSIVFLAGELVRAHRGEMSLTIRRPWLVSFGFGLVHGLGFAGALVELGLPKAAIPLALLCFNVGVEIGQILFVVVALVLIASLSRMEIRVPAWGRALPAYCMGTIAAFWFVGRFLAML